MIPIEPKLKMSCIISRAFILFADVKDKRFTCNTVDKSPLQKTKFTQEIKKRKANYCETVFISSYRNF